MDNNAISAEAGRLWKDMNSEARAPWEARAAEAKRAYDAEVQRFKDSGGRMHDVVPSKPLSARGAGRNSPSRPRGRPPARVGEASDAGDAGTCSTSAPSTS